MERTSPPTSALRLSGLLPLVLVACIFPIDEDQDIPGAATDGETDTDNLDRGWQFQCYNQGNDPNQYARWHEEDPQDPLCPLNEDGSMPEACWLPYYDTEPDVCINATNVDDFDPNNWMAFEDGIRGICSSHCTKMHPYGGPGTANVSPPDPEKCEDEDWSLVVYSGGGSAPDPMGSDCPLSAYTQLELDPDGSEIEWPDQSSAPTHCNLYNGECDDDFDAIVYPWVSPLYPHEDIDVNTRRADYLAVSTTSNVTFYASTGTFVLPLDATVEFSTSSCTSAGCPFYLANLEATQTGGALSISIPYDGGVLQKELTGFKVDLLHSAWGIHHQAQDWLVLTQGTVQLQVEFTLTNTDGEDKGDGSFKKVLVNDDEIFGDRTSSGVDSVVFQREFIPDVTAVIELDDADHVEGPPSVSDTLPSSLQCGSSDTYVELDSYISATDSDGDVDVLGWLIDGEVLSDADVGLDNGVYDIAAVAIDTRGALDMGPVKELTISGCP